MMLQCMFKIVPLVYNRENRPKKMDPLTNRKEKEKKNSSRKTLGKEGK